MTFGFEAVAAFFAEGRDLVLIEWTWKLLIASAVLVSFLDVPYGKIKDVSCLSRLAGWRVNARIGWFFQELPSFLIPVFLVLNYGGKYVGEGNPNIVLVSMFLFHYTQRVFIYSPCVIKKDTQTPIIIPVAGFLFCTLNGYMQSRYLTNFVHYEFSWLYDPRFVVGNILFLLGMAINVQSDFILSTLRKPEETGYKIPRGGMFEFISGANYFGESLEWTGYAIACWNFPALSFAVFVVLFLGSRALQYHRFYKEKFEDYPSSRKAFIPFIL